MIESMDSETSFSNSHLVHSTKNGCIDTDSFSEHLRNKVIDFSQKKILIAELTGSNQEKDISTPVNCNGYGRIRHFCYSQYNDWSQNPLPIVPALTALRRPFSDVVRTQVFQLSACNWRCWYCFVDNDRLSANMNVSKYFTPEELIDLYLEQENPPDVIDLSGGQPDLAPEWILWTMEALEKRNLRNKVFLWSDDNLSSKYFWKFLNPQQIKYIVEFPKYSRVGCFKGYDQDSFSFNTLANPEFFYQQFEIFQNLLREGFDMYAYVTFTSLPKLNIEDSISKFTDKLQEIHPNLPLRTVPLKIEVFTPTQFRLKEEQQQALKFQYEVHRIWLNELENRFSLEQRNISISQISMSLS